jgi:hypothetical protein
LVTIEERHQPVSEIFRQAADQTGVHCSAENEAADLRVTAFVKDVPLRLVLERLGTLLHLTWRREPLGPGLNYTLFLSDDDRRQLAAAKAAEWTEFRANVQRIIRAAIQPAALGNDPRDRAARSIVSGPYPRAAGQFLATLPDAVLDTVLRGEPVRLPMKGMPLIQQEAVRNLQLSAGATHTALERAVGAPAKAPGGRRDRGEQGGAPTPPSLTGIELRVDRSSGDGQHAFLQLSHLDGDNRGSSIALGIDPSASLSLSDQQFLPRHFDSRHCALKAADPLRLPGNALNWTEILERFAHENHVNVLSDAMDVADRRTRHLQIQSPSAGAPIETYLDRLCLPHDYTWNADEGLILFRRRDWYLERERQIPERLAAHWREVARQEGIYPLDDLAEMASMSDGQLVKLWRYAGREASRTVLRNQEILLLYRSLRPEQRALARGGGLPIDRFDIAQQKLLPAVITRARPGPSDVSRAFVRLHTSARPKEPKAEVILNFRDGERRTIPLDRTAKPLPDPFATTGLFDGPLPNR